MHDIKYNNIILDKKIYLNNDKNLASFCFIIYYLIINRQKQPPVAENEIMLIKMFKKDHKKFLWKNLLREGRERNLFRKFRTRNYLKKAFNTLENKTIIKIKINKYIYYQCIVSI